MATTIWLATSGGVITADRIKTMTKAILRYFVKISGVTKPTLVRKKMIIGNSNITPQAMTEALTVAMKELISISLSTSSLT